MTDYEIALAHARFEDAKHVHTVLKTFLTVHVDRLKRDNVTGAEDLMHTLVAALSQSRIVVESTRVCTCTPVDNLHHPDCLKFTFEVKP